MFTKYNKNNLMAKKDSLTQILYKNITFICI